ncbi:MAG: cadherin domain-containing protein [Candidatus Poribacteria bacterium]|nr:cadherin domain-containing protein [Candidatus Poribacteria bacterium]
MAYGIDVADRTPQVRDAIVAAAGVGTPEEVTEDHLSDITLLRLGLSNITSLKTGDFEGLASLEVLLLNSNQLTELPETVFSGLTSLEVLLLNSNQLTELPETVFSGLASLQVLFLNNNALTDLPAGVFSGLTVLSALNLNNNAVDPIDLPVSLERVADGQFKAVAPTGAPFDIRLPFRIANGSISSNETPLTIPQGSLESDIFSVDRTPGTLAAVSVDIGVLPGLPRSHSGYAVLKSGDPPLVLIDSAGIHPLSDRTPQVRDAIVVAAGVGTPEEVTEAHLSAITTLRLGFSDITALNVTDFDGLTALQELHLNNNQLTDLPEAVFDSLASLEVLLLNNNQLTDLPAGVFDSLTSLEVLLLNNNQLTALPETVFSGLASLQHLYLDSNRLTALPETVFSGLTALQYLYLNNNLYQNNNAVPIPVTVSLERVAKGQFKAVMPTGAPFDIRLPIRVPNGFIRGGATRLTIPQGSLESETLTVTRTPGTLLPVTAEIGVLPRLPEAHRGYAVVKPDDLPIVLIRADAINPLIHRTPQVGDAILAAAGVGTPEEITVDHLSNIISLDLSFSSITSLKAGDFDDLTALESLNLNNNRLTALPETVFSRLTALHALNLNNNWLTALPETVFSGLTALHSLNLNNNALTELPAGVFSGLTALESLNINNNAVDPIELAVSLERVADGQFKAVAPTGAPFDIRLPFRISNGSISSGETALTIPQGGVESEILTVDHTFETLQLLTAAIETLPGLPAGHSGYALVQPTDVPLVLVRSDGINPISDRTPQVQDAIVAAAGVNFPDEVTEDHLSSITLLNLGLSNITSLNPGDFEGLTALQVLLLNNNQLTDLPETVFNGLTSLQQLDLSNNRFTILRSGVFDGLMALQSLNLNNNATEPVALMVSLERVDDGQFKAVMPTCAPFDIVLPINMTNGSIFGGATDLTIPQGLVESETFSVTRTPRTILPVTAAIETLPELPVGHSGYAVVQSSDLPILLIGSQDIHPLRERTPQVSDAILAAAGVDAPEEVTAVHLSAITTLDLSFSDTTALNDRDFEGLMALEVLLLNNNQLTDLPETVFNGLTSVQYLYLSDNQLTALPARGFSELPLLEVLLLNNNQLTDLPETVFNGLTALEQLDLSHNAFTDLPEAVFSGLTALQSLNLNNNATEPVALTVSLQQVADEQQFKAVVPTGSPFEIRLPINITNGSLLGGATTLTIPQGDMESGIFTVEPIPGTRTPVTADIGNLPRLPISHSGYALVKSDELPLVLIEAQGINLLSDRTPQVRDAIVAAAGVTSPEEVTEAHLSAMTSLDLSDSTIVSLNAGDFEGLTSLEVLSLNNNQLTFLPVGVFNELTSLQRLDLNNNSLTFLPIGIFGGLASLEGLLLDNNPLRALPEAVFNGLTSLQSLSLNSNTLTFLPAGIFNGLTALQALDLSDNAAAPIALPVSLERVAAGQFKAVAPTGAPFDIVLPIRIANGRISGNETSLTIPQGSVESETLSVTQVFESLTAVTAAIDTLPSLPEAHRGYAVVKSSDLPLALFYSDRIKPLSERTPQVRDAIVAAAGVGTPEEVTEAHLAAITSLGLTDSQITALNDRDFEGLMSLEVLLLNNNPLTALPEAVFSGLMSLQYLNLDSNQLTALPEAVFSRLTALQSLNLSNNAVDPIELIVSLERVADTEFKAVIPTGAPFDVLLPINMTNGMISGGVTALTISQGRVESETVSVLRTPGTRDSITAALDTLPELPVGHSGYALLKSSAPPLVFINIPGASDTPGSTAPVFTDGDTATRSVAENTPPNTNIGAPVAATGADGQTLAYTLGGTDAAAFSIVSTSGQLQTNAALDFETKNTYEVVVSVSDGNNGSDSITVSISVTDVNEAPVFTDGDTATRAIAENTAADTNIGAVFAATDPDVPANTLTYTLGGADAAAFGIVSTTGQLQTRTALDYETKDSYAVTVSVSDGTLTDSITVTITVTDVNEAPVFADGDTATRAIAENTAADTNIGTAVTATDPDADSTLSWTLDGTDAAAFSIISTSGQLQTDAALDFETKDTYEVVVSVSDGTLTDSITVTITVTDVNEAPVFAEDTATRSIAENTATGTDIGAVFAATDVDADTTLSWTLGGTDAAAFRIVTTSGQLQTDAALDYETRSTYEVVVSVSDGTLTDSTTVTISVTDVNEAPVFTEGDTATRSIAENTATGTNIGTPVAATDPDVPADTLTYTLGGTDAAAFRIVGTSGQLQTRAALDYETDDSYTVTVSASDGTLTDSITVTISVTDVNENEAPVFTEGDTATRSVAENTAADTDIGTAVTATDPDADSTLTWTLGGTDAAAFGIVSTSGQLQTRAALDHETKDSYTVTVTASDGTLTDSITVTITVTDVNEAPVFAEDTATRSVAENTAADTDIGEAVAATDVDADTTLTYTLGGTDAAAFDIVSTSGQLQTKAALDHETKDSYTVTITASDGSLSDSITVTISVTDVNEAPVFTEGDTATRSVAENTAADTNIGAVFAATDVDRPANTLTYSLGGTDAAAFGIVSNSGQLQTKAALDYETKTSYTVTVSVSDGTLTDSITVTITVTDVNEAPVFTEGDTATRSIAENTAADTNIGTPVTATHQDTLTYTLGGTDAAAFGIVSNSGQLQTKAALDHETKDSYTVTVTASDGTLTDSITVTISVTDVNEAPVLTDGATATRAIAENTAASTNIGAVFAATDPDVPANTLTYSLGGTDAAAFGIVSNSGQLRTKSALDHETKASYTVTVSVSDGTLTDSITVTITVTDVNEAPSFATATATRSVAENTAADTNIGTPVAATDQDVPADTLTYTLGGTDAAAFSIVSTSGQLQTKAALNHEDDDSYTVTVSVSDGTLTDSITVTITVTDVNEAPVLTDGTTATRAIAENTATDTNIGAVFAATDPDGDTLSYALGGTDAAAFSIVSTSGQLRTKAALDYETKTSYTVTVSVSDGTLTDSITVTITVTDVNEAPVFTEGDTATRAIAENTAVGTNIGAAVAATSATGSVTEKAAAGTDIGEIIVATEANALTYSLGGTDAASFSVVSTTGQLQTKAALDYETDDSYTVTVSVLDGTLSDSIAVTINVTDVNEAPVFTEGATATRAIAENTAADTNIGTAIAATDPDADSTLTYTLGGTDAAAFGIVSTTGQLQTKAALDHETKDSYTVTVSVSDGTLTDSITVTISVTDVNDAPVFTDGTTATRAIAENTVSGRNIGTAVAATDQDVPANTLTYTLGGTDAAAFSIVSTSGQLQTKSSLDRETKASYAVTVSVSDGNSGTDSIAVTINVIDVNDAPSFPDLTATRSVAENTATGTNIGAAVAATDVDRPANTLTYTLGGTDASSFGIVSTTGQLQTKAALNYETKTSYAVTVSVSDGALTDSIAVTITVTDVNEAPVLTDGATATRSVAENTATNTNIGGVFAATDVDRPANTLTYSLSGTDAAAFGIVSTSGQLQTKSALNHETKSSYTVTVSVSDGALTDSITVTITVTDVNEAPVFTEGATATRSVAENTAANTNIGTAIAATDPDVPANTLTYTLGGTDAASFGIVSTSGQLQTKAALDYETKTSYTVTVSVSDGTLTDSITVTITVTDVNEAPVLTAGTTATRSIAENTAADTNIGAVFAATDVDRPADTLTYTLGGTDASAFSIVSTSGQLQTKAALDHETKSSYTVTVTVSDGTLTDSITVTISVTDVNDAPVLTEGTTATRSVAENTLANTNIGAVFAATDVDRPANTLSWTLGGTDAAAFGIVSTSGQLQTKAALDRETKDSYTVTVSVSDGNGGSDSITVTISVTDVNEEPSFATNTATRSIAENTAAGANIGTPVAATDVDGNTLTYTLGGTDAASFDIVSTSGQLQTKAALNHETKASYTVTVTASDSILSDSITVTISVTDVNDAPSFATDTATRSIAENRARGTNIGAVIAATDEDGDTLTYTLSGSHASFFSIVSTTGQIKVHDPPNYESSRGTSRSVTVTASDGTLTDSIAVTINVTDVNEPPRFRDGRLKAFDIAENTPAGTEIGTVRTTDEDGDSLTYTLHGEGASSFDIVSTSSGGQLQTKDPLDYEDRSSYVFYVDVTDGSLRPQHRFQAIIRVTNVDPENHPLPNARTQQVLEAIVAAVPGVTNADELTAAHLAAITALDINNKNITSLKTGDFDGLTSLRTLDLGRNAISDISVLEHLTSLTHLYLTGNPISDYGPLRSLKAANRTISIDISLDNTPPVFTEGATTTRSVAENTVSGTSIGTAVAATDADNHTLIYTLSGTDAAAFDIGSTSGQLRTKDPLDYATKSAYTVTVTVYDDNSGGDRITVTINVTKVIDDVPFAQILEAVGNAPSARTPHAIPERTLLFSNFPNPFNPETWIPYQLAEPANVTLTIYNMRGVIVRALKLGHKSAGMYTNRSRAIHWDGRNMFGEKVATGVYFYTLKAGEFSATRKMLIRK